MKYYFSLMDLEDQMDMVFAQDDHHDGIYYYFPKDDARLPNITDSDQLYTILPDGEELGISNLQIFLQNRDKILKKGLAFLDDYIKSAHMSYNEYLQLVLKDKNKYARTKEDAIKYKLEYIQTAIKITSIYILTHQELDEVSKNEKAQEEIRNTIKNIREENENEIKNELDMVNKVIQDAFPDNQEELCIDSCTYNGQEMDQNELITKLASHMLPAFMTQINILDTLDDSYTIKTNLGTIIRESKTGRITIIED